MEADLIFEDWFKIGEPDSIYNTEIGIELSMGDLHSGTTFKSKIIINEQIEKEILEYFKEFKAYPSFRLIPYISE